MTIFWLVVAWLCIGILTQMWVMGDDTIKAVRRAQIENGETPTSDRTVRNARALYSLLGPIGTLHFVWSVRKAFKR